MRGLIKFSLLSDSGMSEQRYQVILIRKDEHILTPGELSIEDAKKKAAYLSQYGAVDIVGAEQPRDAEVGESPQLVSASPCLVLSK